MNTVFITGATSGIGYQLTSDYLSAGSKVVACGRNPIALQSLDTMSHELETLQFDITNATSTKQALQQMQSHPDIWIFNAGSCEYIEYGNLDCELIKRVFDVNFMGLVNSIEATQPYFSEGDKVYGASKAAVSYLARTLQLTLQHKGVSVIVVYPGFVKTPLTDKNTFKMPMMVSSEDASKAIRIGIEKNRSYIYFPTRFTSIIRLISSLPYRWQNLLTTMLFKG